MSMPILLPPAFDGMALDFPRNNLPKGKAWSLVDYIPQELGAPATERAGWGYASPDLTAVDASATYALAGVEAPFTAATQIVLIDDNAKLIKMVAGANTLIAGTANKPVQNPFMHQQLVVIPSPEGTTAPQKYDGTALAALGATAPAGKYGCVFVNYTWLGGSTANPYRSYASAVGDPTAYVQTGPSASYLDTSFPVKGYAALPNVMLIFGDETTARVRGGTPPPNTDMQLDDPIFQYGCIDARSIAVNGSLCVFANSIGVFLTNGTAFPEDLTRSCGMSRYWRGTMTNFSSSTWTVASGWFGNLVIVGIDNGFTFDTIVFDTVKRQAYRLTNLRLTFLAAAGQAGQELYAGHRSHARLLKLSPMFGFSFSLDNIDADGTPVLAQWESPFYDTQKMGSQRWRDAFLEYDLRAFHGTTPTYSVKVTTSPESNAPYVTLSPTVGATTRKTPAKFPIRRKSRGLGFLVTRAGTSSAARLYGIGATVYPREGSRIDA